MILHDRIKETTTSTGTGGISLDGAVVGFKTLSSRYGAGEALHYAIVGGSQWEVGEGYLSSTTTLVRSVVFESSNSDNLVNFSAGTKDVFITLSATLVSSLQTVGQAYAIGIGLARS